MSKRSVHHATFTIERTYDASPARVFAAWSDPKLKPRWFRGPDEWARSEHVLDFRVGGRESVAGGPRGGVVHSYNAIYKDIVPNERIVSTYEMHMDDTLFSVSLATVELKAKGKGTLLVYTEAGVYLDGDGEAMAKGREEGTRGLLDQLERELRG
jgi:uncharacterized protein YndB with AHSA1/START domain